MGEGKLGRVLWGESCGEGGGVGIGFEWFGLCPGASNDTNIHSHIRARFHCCFVWSQVAQMLGPEAVASMATQQQQQQQQVPSTPPPEEPKKKKSLFSVRRNRRKDSTASMKSHK